MTEAAPQRDFPLHEVFKTCAGSCGPERLGAEYPTTCRLGTSSVNSPSAGSKSASPSHSFITCAPCYGSPKSAKKARRLQFGGRYDGASARLIRDGNW